jgi:hypothetical protein
LKTKIYYSGGHPVRNISIVLASQNKRMRRLTASVLVLFTSIAFISCSKEVSFEPSSAGSGNGPGSGSNGTLLGNYKFISMEVSTKAIDEMSVGVSQKTITTTHYTTTGNSGTMSFDGSKASATNLSYSVDTVAKAEVYINGALQDSLRCLSSLRFRPAVPQHPIKWWEVTLFTFPRDRFLWMALHPPLLKLPRAELS